MVNTIICPQCKKEIKIDEALDHELREQVLGTVKLEHQKDLEEVRKVATEEAKKSVSDKYITDMEFLKKQLQEKDNKVSEYRNQELKLREEKAKIEEDRKELEVTVQRRLEEEKKKAEQVVAEDYKLKLLEKDKRLESMAKTIEELKQKSNLTSQQLQGEVLELDIQNTLMQLFPDDKISEVEKFRNGSDIIQVVQSKGGISCGKILWECKRVSVFKPDFVKKIKEDLLKEEGDYGIIVSTTLPKEAKDGLGKLDDNIWVCGTKFIEYLSVALRETLIKVAKEKWLANKNKDGRADKLLSYFLSNQFTQQLKEQAEIWKLQKAQIDKERIAFAKIWADRENQVTRQFTSVAKIVSTIGGYVGTSMPQIEGFELQSLEDGKK